MGGVTIINTLTNKNEKNGERGTIWWGGVGEGENLEPYDLEIEVTYHT
jgi:hypothetical protein